MSDDAPISQADIDAGRLILRKRSPDGGVIQPKKRVTLYLDAAPVDRFKKTAGERGYQTLINETLRTSLTHVCRPPKKHHKVQPDATRGLPE